MFNCENFSLPTFLSATHANLFLSSSCLYSVVICPSCLFFYPLVCFHTVLWTLSVLLTTPFSDSDAARRQPATSSWGGT